MISIADVEFCATLDNFAGMYYSPQWLATSLNVICNTSLLIHLWNIFVNPSCCDPLLLDFIFVRHNTTKCFFYSGPTTHSSSGHRKHLRRNSVCKVYHRLRNNCADSLRTFSVLILFSSIECTLLVVSWCKWAENGESLVSQWQLDYRHIRR